VGDRRAGVLVIIERWGQLRRRATVLTRDAGLIQQLE
jgi:hypothetical protein